jgi:uncharacterized protein (DUF1810 family)
MKVIDTIVQNVNIIYYERRLKVVGIQCLRKDAVFLRKCTNSFTRSATLKTLGSPRNCSYGTLFDAYFGLSVDMIERI